MIISHDVKSNSALIHIVCTVGLKSFLTMYIDQCCNATCTSINFFYLVVYIVDPSDVNVRIYMYMYMTYGMALCFRRCSWLVSSASAFASGSALAPLWTISHGKHLSCLQTAHLLNLLTAVMWHAQHKTRWRHLNHYAWCQRLALNKGRITSHKESTGDTTFWLHFLLHVH